MKEMLYAVRCLKSNEDMILALAGQFNQRKPEGQTNEFKESRVPLKSQILVVVRMNGYRKVPIFKINCSKEFRTRQKVQ